MVESNAPANLGVRAALPDLDGRARLEDLAALVSLLRNAGNLGKDRFARALVRDVGAAGRPARITGRRVAR